MALARNGPTPDPAGDPGDPNAPPGAGQFAENSPDLMNFEDEGSLVNTGSAPFRDQGGDAYYAYSRILAEGLKSQSTTIIEFVKTAALSLDLQKICVDRLLSWFWFVFNAPVCNRYGLIESTESRIAGIEDEAEDTDDDAIRDAAVADIAKARELAAEYAQHKGKAGELLASMHSDMSAQNIVGKQAEYQTARQSMDSLDSKAMSLSGPAYEIYSHLLYIRWIEDWIAEDEKAGLPVSQYDFSAVKRKLQAKDVTVLDLLDSLPLAIQKAYQICMMSMSSGEEWRQMFILGITFGNGVMPPQDESGKKKWYDRFLRRGSNPQRPRSHGSNYAPVR